MRIRLSLITFGLIFSCNALAWEYINSSDKLRGIETKSARLISSDTASIAGKNVHLGLSIMPFAGNDYYVAFATDGALFHCVSEYREHDGLCQIHYKIDDGPVRSAFAHIGENSAFGTLKLIDGASFLKAMCGPAFLKQLCVGSKMTVEVEFYKDGNRQFEFDVSGLDRSIIP